MSDNVTRFESKKGPALARVTLSDNFCEQTRRGTSEGILRGYAKDNQSIAIVEIPGEPLPVRVHVSDFTIVN